MVRAKFRVSHITDYGSGLKEVHLTPVTDDGIPENQRFHKHTPSGEIKMSITNPTAFEQFAPGQTFYVDFTPAE